MPESSAATKGSPAADVVARRSGVELVAARRTQWPGFTRVVLDLQWLTEPGWIELVFDQAAAYVVAREIGGRCELRLHPDRPYEGAYIGLEHASLVTAGTPVTIRAQEMRRATVVCCVLTPSEGNSAAVSNIMAAPVRLMIRSRPLHNCAVLFEGPSAADPADAFALALAEAVLLAWSAAAASPAGIAQPQLRGERLLNVLSFIRNELDQPIRIQDLADAAGLAPAEFGVQFHAVTGMTPQAWQMDARVRNAQRLMIDDPNGSLEEFAALCGFSDQSHFSRVFLKIIGKSPTEWLNRYI
jgi:AraC-like DNA-binding protein